MKTEASISLRIPAKSEHIPIASFAARQYASGLGFPDEDADRICLALEEAAANAVEFGFGGSGESLRIELSSVHGGLGIVLRSRGLPLEEEHLPRYDPDRAHGHDDTAGLSSLLMERMMDRVSFSLRGADERELTMLKYLPGEAATEEAESPGPVEKSDAEVEVRLARPEEAEGISRLALRSHGAVLFSEHIYYPARVREMLASEQMTSVVVVSDTGEVVGHGARVAHMPGARVEEMTYAVVDPRFRSRGCIKDVAIMLMEDAERRDLHALEAFAVTNHIHSQRPLVVEDFKECFLLLRCSSPSHTWSGGKGEVLGRIGNLGFVKLLERNSGATLHVPPRHRQMVGKICDYVGIDARFSDEVGDGAEVSGEPILHTMEDYKEGWAMMAVEEYGRGVEAKVVSGLRRASEHNLYSVQMLLPLDDPATPHMTGRFEEMGFFFGGVAVNWDTSVCLVLQHIHGADGGYDDVNVATDFARELTEYIRSCDPAEK